MFAIARYKMIDHFRKSKTRPTVPIEGMENLFSTPANDEAIVSRDLDTLLSRLPKRQRALVMDVKLQGLSMDEAGQQFGMTGLAARVSVSRALQFLKRGVRDEDR